VLEVFHSKSCAFQSRKMIVCQSDWNFQVPNIVTRLEIEADKDSFKQWQVCCSFTLEDTSSDTLIM
jgi:hypothetical protein